MNSLGVVNDQMKKFVNDKLEKCNIHVITKSAKANILHELFSISNARAIHDSCNEIATSFILGVVEKYVPCKIYSQNKYTGNCIIGETTSLIDVKSPSENTIDLKVVFTTKAVPDDKFITFEFSIDVYSSREFNEAFENEYLLKNMFDNDAIDYFKYINRVMMLHTS